MLKTISNRQKKNILGIKGGSYWSCANANPSCKRLHLGMKTYHKCAVSKGCKQDFETRRTAQDRLARAERGERGVVSNPERGIVNIPEQKEREVKSQDSGTQTELPLEQAPRVVRRRPRTRAPDTSSRSVRDFFDRSNT